MQTDIIDLNKCVVFIFFSLGINPMLLAQNFFPYTHTNPAYVKPNYNLPEFHHVGGYKKEVKSRAHPFTIVLKTDSAIQVDTKIDVSYSRHFLTVKDRNGDELAITPPDTKELYRFLPNGLKISGIPADSCWLFRIQSGKINSYSFLAEPDTKFLIAIQNGQDGPIIRLGRKNLLAIMGENAEEKIKELVKEKEFIKAINLFNAKFD